MAPPGQLFLQGAACPRAAADPSICPALPSQVVLSHTPFRELVPRLGEEPVLVAGRGQVRCVCLQTLDGQGRSRRSGGGVAVQAKPCSCLQCCSAERLLLLLP